MSLDLEAQQAYNSVGTGPDACAFVRYASEKDLPQVLEMYIESVLEVAPHTKINRDRCIYTVADSYNRAPCVLIQKGQEIIAFAGLTLATEDFSDETYIQEYMLYIKKKFRSVKMAKMLSDAVKDVSDKFGIPLRFFKTIGKSNVQDRANFLERWGYEPFTIGCTYGARK